MSQEDHENDASLWESQLWANFCKDDFSNSGDDKVNEALEKTESKGKKRGPGMAKKGKGERRERGESSGHDTHIWTERERRKKMRNMFSTLRSLLPDVPAKLDKSAIVEEAAKYIRTLQDTLRRLEKQKLEKLQGSNSLSSIAGSSKLAMLSTRETITAGQVSSNYNDSNQLPVDRTNQTPSSSHLLPPIIQTWSSANVVLNVCGNDAQFVVYAPKKPGLFANICSVLEKYRLDAVSVHITSDARSCTYIMQACLANRTADELVSVEERYKHAAVEIITLLTS